jgi:aldose 1-epimerase
MDHILTIPAEAYTPVDAALIPTGEIRPVAGTVFDFRNPTVIGARVRTSADEQIRIGRGYDHNWVVSPRPPATMQLMARVTDPHSGRSLELWSDQPGLQFYSGNFLDATSKGKSGSFYRQGDAIVLEPQAFPDTVNRPNFGSIQLEAGQAYSSHMVYKFRSVPARR